MTFWQTFKASYTGGMAFMLAYPALIAIPVAFELLQHVVEVHRGMYASLVAAKAADADPVRLGFGLLKVATLTLSSYWIVRFLAWRDPARAGAVEAPAARLFAGVLAFQLILTAVQLFALPRTGGVLLSEALAGFVLGVLLAAWIAAAALGNARIGPWASARIMMPRLLWSAGLSLAVVLPLMVPHYVLGALALVGPKALLWPVLIVDALLVGLLAAVMSASGYLIAKRGADGAGVPLVGSDVETPNSVTTITTEAVRR